MSTAMAIAGVTAVLQFMIRQSYEDNGLSSIFGDVPSVTAVAPNSVLTNGGLEESRLNIFFHRATHNMGWSTACLPSRDGVGQRLTNQPMALDLHYLLTAYGVGDLRAEILLGYAMQVLHETPGLSRDQIGNVFNFLGGELSVPLQQSRLADQVEQIKIAQEHLNTEEMSKLWTALQSNYYPTAAYVATVVLIETERPVRSPLPVLTRGARIPAEVAGEEDREQGIIAQPSLIPPVPTITAIELPQQQLSVRLGEQITIQGHHLEGTNISVQFVNDRLPDPIPVEPQPGSTAANVTVLIPDVPADWISGFYRISVQVLQPLEGQLGQFVQRITNELPLLIAPTLQLPPDDVVVAPDPENLEDWNVTVTLTCSPEVRSNQNVSLILGQHEAPVVPFVEEGEVEIQQTSQLSFVYHNLPAGDYVVRLRVDGVESWLINRSVTPPAFDTTQQITVPA